MNLYKSSTYLSDLKKVVEETPLLDFFTNKSVLITGASGLVCSPIVDLLLTNNEINNAETIIYVAGRPQDNVLRRFNKYTYSKWLVSVDYDATKEITFNVDCDFIIHGASNAHPKAIADFPVETMLDNFKGMYELLEYAHRKHVKRSLYISSSEIYGQKKSMEPFNENEFGYIDLQNPRNSYSVGKRATETLCASYSKEYGTETVIVRPGHIFGPTASLYDNRISSAFAFDAANGRNLVMKSDGSQIRSYCYMLDSASAILTVLVKGENGEAYNISNPNSIISIREIAELYSKYGGVKLDIAEPSVNEKNAFNPMQNSSLNSDKLLALGWRGLFDANEGVEHTVQIIREASKEV